MKQDKISQEKLSTIQNLLHQVAPTIGLSTVILCSTSELIKLEKIKTNYNEKEISPMTVKNP